jgi:hypothetical protein
MSSFKTTGGSSVPSFTPQEVLRSFAESRRTGLIEATIPEVTNIRLDPSKVVEIARDAPEGGFAEPTGFAHETRRRNLVRDIGFICFPDKVSVSEKPDTDVAGNRETADSIDQRLQTARRVAKLLRPIDKHFRNWAGIAGETEPVPLEPVITLLAGNYSGDDVFDSYPHFDYGAQMPHVSYKIHYDGDPEHSSIYYPGSYRRPGALTRLMRTFRGENPLEIRRIIPKGQNLGQSPVEAAAAAEQAVHIMPSRVVCIEPWNVCHGGPTDEAARNTQRGILSVSYNLATPQLLPRL